MRKILALFLLLSLFSAISAYAQDLYFLDSPSGDLSPNLKAAIQDNMSEIINSHAKAKTSNNIDQANYTLSLSAIKLNNSFLISLKKCQSPASSATCPYSSQMKISSLDEIDNAVKRLTVAAVLNEDVSTDRQIGTVADNETNQLQKSVMSRRSLKLGLGLSNLIGLRAKNDNVNYALLLGWGTLLSKQVGFNVDTSFFFDGSGRDLYMFGLGPQFYFSADDTSPYVKASINYYGADNNYSSNNGIAVGTAVGVTFFRTTDVNLFVEAGYVLGTKNMDGNLPSALYSMLGVAF